MSIDEIKYLCRIYGIKNYIINDDLSVDVYNNINLQVNIGKLPFKFNRVSGFFFCYEAGLESLEGCPKEVGGFFSCCNNNLTSLEGMPDAINGNIECVRNNIKSFKGVPETFDGFFRCELNPIYEVYKLFRNNSKCIYWLNEYDVIRGDNVVIDRLEEVFIQIGMRMPDFKEIKGYNLV